MICPNCKYDPCRCDNFERRKVGRVSFKQVRMLYLHGVDPARWARKHGIIPFTAPCQDCGKAQATVLPILVGVQPGIAVDCTCGSHVPYTLLLPDDWRKGLTGEETD